MKCWKYLLFNMSGAGLPFNKAGNHGAEVQLLALTVSGPRRVWSMSLLWFNQTNKSNQQNKKS